MGCTLFNPLSYGSCVGDAATSAAEGVFASVARSFADAAQSATSWLWGQLSAATAVELGGTGFDTLLGVVAAIAGTVAVALFVLQVAQSALRRDPGGLGRAVRGLFVAFLAGGVAVAVVNLLLAATDALCNGVTEVALGTDPTGLGQLVLGSAATATLAGMVSGAGGAAGVLLLALAILAAVVIVYLALVVRKVLIVITAVFAPLAFAGSLADITAGWVRRWVEVTVALVVSKLVLVLIFVVGYFMLVQGAGQAGPGVGQQVTQVVAGVIVLALAGFAPWLALRVVHFTGDHAQQLHAMASASTGGAMAASRMAQRAAPLVQRGLPALANGAGAGGTGGVAGGLAGGQPSTSSPTVPPPGGGGPSGTAQADGPRPTGPPPAGPTPRTGPPSAKDQGTPSAATPQGSTGGNDTPVGRGRKARRGNPRRRRVTAPWRLGTERTLLHGW